MPDFIPGRELSRGFYFACAKPILDTFFPELRYTAGLLGYGSDVLGFDDEVSRDHMWGPRFYLFLDEADRGRAGEILSVFRRELPYTYRGYSVNFTPPDPSDNGVRHARYIDRGEADPLIFIYSIPEYLCEYLGRADLDALTAADWLAFSEHRLLALASAELYTDALGLAERLRPLAFYPRGVKLYLIASLWDAVDAEEAFQKRCGARGDELGSRLICARIAERLMRLCFLYRDSYAPYGKWFGTAFSRLPVDPAIGEELSAALSAGIVSEREEHLTRAELLVAALHDSTGLTPPVNARIEPYFGRDIRVIHAGRIAESVRRLLKGTALENVPLMGSFSQFGGLPVSDEPAQAERLRRFYEN